MAVSTRRRHSSSRMVAVPAPVVLGVAMVVVVLASSATGASGQLRMGFYAESCPGVERMVGDFVRQHVRRVPTVAAALLRLHFHDCFVRVRDYARCCVHCTAACRCQLTASARTDRVGVHDVHVFHCRRPARAATPPSCSTPPPAAWPRRTRRRT
jgi:hypothetical protein